jgi:hypothetical protein
MYFNFKILLCEFKLKKFYFYGADSYSNDLYVQARFKPQKHKVTANPWFVAKIAHKLSETVIT